VHNFFVFHPSWALFRAKQISHHTEETFHVIFGGNLVVPDGTVLSLGKSMIIDVDSIARKVRMKLRRISDFWLTIGLLQYFFVRQSTM